MPKDPKRPKDKETPKPKFVRASVLLAEEDQESLRELSKMLLKEDIIPLPGRTAMVRLALRLGRPWADKERIIELLREIEEEDGRKSK